MNRKQRRATRAEKRRPNNPASGETTAEPNPTGVVDLLATGWKLHKLGRVAEAEVWYRRVLAAQPDHGNALNLLGIVAHQTGRRELAVELIGRAIQMNGQDASYFSNLGIAFRTIPRRVRPLVPLIFPLPISKQRFMKGQTSRRLRFSRGCLVKRVKSSTRQIPLDGIKAISIQNGLLRVDCVAAGAESGGTVFGHVVDGCQSDRVDPQRAESGHAGTRHDVTRTGVSGNKKPLVMPSVFGPCTTRKARLIHRLAFLSWRVVFGGAAIVPKKRRTS